jgi:hypothetical protein
MSAIWPSSTLSRAFKSPKYHGTCPQGPLLAPEDPYTNLISSSITVMVIRISGLRYVQLALKLMIRRVVILINSMLHEEIAYNSKFVTSWPFDHFRFDLRQNELKIWNQ